MAHKRPNKVVIIIIYVTIFGVWLVAITTGRSFPATLLLVSLIIDKQGGNLKVAYNSLPSAHINSYTSAGFIVLLSPISPTGASLVVEL